MSGRQGLQYEHMLRRPGPLHAIYRWCWSTAAVMATIAQLGVAVLPLVEARNGRSAEAHMEAGGVTAHYAHNEAACAACQARSIIGTAAGRPLALTVPFGAPVAPSHLVERPHGADLSLHWNPRAPPSVI